MQDAAKRQASPLVTALLLDAPSFFPQITQIDADDITKGPGLDLRYLRHLRAKWGGWANLESGI